MKQKVVHLTSESRRRLLRLYNAIGALLRSDFSSEGLRSRNRFIMVRPALYSLYSYLWGKDDLALTKVVSVDHPEYLDVKVEVPSCFVPESSVDLPF